MRRPRDLPNQHGFEFIGVTNDRSGCRVNVRGIVVQDPETGCHYTEGVKYCDLIGWEPLAQAAESCANFKEH